MSENENADFDPFADDAAQDAPPASDDVFDDISFGEGDDDPFADADFAMEEEDSGEVIKVRDAGAVYEDPLDVGLKEGMWVPILLSEVSLVEKHIPRLSSDVCLAVETLPNGKKRVHVPYDKVEEKLKQPNVVEVIRKQPLPYFVASANHVAPEFGQRKYPYEIEVPALTVKTAAYKPQPGKKTGYPNKNGYSLRKATGATEKGEVVNLETMPEIAKRMEDKIVLVKITLSTKMKTRPIKDGNGQAVTVLANPQTGDPIVVIAVPGQKAEDGQVPQPTYLLDDGSGQEWNGNSQLLVPYGVPAHGDPHAYVISDASENAVPLMEEYAKTTDYLKPPFLPLPERQITVEMIEPKVRVTEASGKSGESGTVEIQSEEEVVKMKGEITLATIGAIAQGNTSGTSVDVLLQNGKTITAVWLGTHWVELAPEKKDGEGDGLDEFAGVKNL